jgi:hypothetical protein
MFQLSNALSFNYFSKSYLQNYKSNNFLATIFEFFSAPEETELFYIKCMYGCCSVIFENVKITLYIYIYIPPETAIVSKNKLHNVCEITFC